MMLMKNKIVNNNEYRISDNSCLHDFLIVPVIQSLINVGISIRQYYALLDFFDNPWEEYF